jgi:hypothetical protein
VTDRVQTLDGGATDLGQFLASYLKSRSMDETSQLLTGQTISEPIPRTNRGWFRQGDRRINREGRPLGPSKRAPTEASSPADLAPCADRLMLLIMRSDDLAWRLTRRLGPWIVNLPEDFEIIWSRVDAESGNTVLVIRSATFARVAKGAPIPTFKKEFNGLRWSRLSSIYEPSF